MENIETVKEFINRISEIDGVKVFAGKEKECVVEEYLQKLQKLGERKNKEIDIDFLRENLERNVKYVVEVNYTDEEKALAESIFEEQIKIKDENREEREKKRESIKKEMIAQSPVGESYMAKQETGARPGQYIQGRIVYSNMSDYEELLLSHETTHAARMEIFDINGEHVCPEFDKLPVVTNSEKFLRQFPSTRPTAGYDRGQINAEGETVELPHEEDKTQLMEICTESIAGMMNEKDEKTFEKFSIPTHKMSAITYMEKTRNLLIMAIGSDDFIFDMLKRDTNESYRKLNQKMKQYKETASILEYLEICGEDEKLEKNTKENREELSTFAVNARRLNGEKENTEIHGYIPSKTRIKKMMFDIASFRLDDKSFYKTVVDYVRNSDEKSITNNNYIMHIIQCAIINYFGYKGTESRRNALYEQKGDIDDKPLSISEFQGNGTAMCVERSAMGQNILAFLGYDPMLIYGYMSTDKGITNEGHAYNCIIRNGKAMLVDFTNPLYKDGKYFRPACFPVDKENLNNFIKGKAQVEVKHKDYYNENGERKEDLTSIVYASDKIDSQYFEKKQQANLLKTGIELTQEDSTAKEIVEMSNKAGENERKEEKVKEDKIK